MATYEIPANKLITCPYDEAHRVKASRFQLHVSKCMLNHLDETKQICPFNAQHRLENGTLSYHLMNCPDRASLDKKLVASTENSTFKGHTGVPSYNSLPIEPRENWDTELATQPLPGYQPRLEPPNGGIRTEFSTMKQSQRKQYYKDLHHRNPGDEEESEEMLEKSDDSLPVLRKPTTKSYAQLLNEQKPVHELQNIGLGRGQPVSSPSTRIAANIFGQQVTPIPMRQPRSAPNIPGFQQPNLGMGRGSGITATNGNTSLGEMHVNKVGFGRGAKR